MDLISATITGDKELKVRLESMGDAVTRRVLKSATAKAMTPVSKSAKANARKIKDTGLLAQSIGKKTKLYRRSDVAVAIVGPRAGFRKSVVRRGQSRSVLADPGKYAHLVEFGHSIVRGGRVVGRVRAFPWLRPALHQNRALIIQKWRQEMSRGTEREWGKFP